MSASPVARQATQSQLIPSRRVVITNDSSLPADYSSTPGGTLFSTTPGGTRIVYERQFLMQLRNSPMAKTPPKNIQYFPGISPTKQQSGLLDNNNTHKLKERKTSSPDRNRPSPLAQVQPSVKVQPDEQFEMDL